MNALRRSSNTSQARAPFHLQPTLDSHRREENRIRTVSTGALAAHMRNDMTRWHLTANFTESRSFLRRSPRPSRRRSTCSNRVRVCQFVRETKPRENLPSPSPISFAPSLVCNYCACVLWNRFKCINRNDTTYFKEWCNLPLNKDHGMKLLSYLDDSAGLWLWPPSFPRISPSDIGWSAGWPPTRGQASSPLAFILVRRRRCFTPESRWKCPGGRC